MLTVREAVVVLEKAFSIAMTEANLEVFQCGEELFRAGARWAFSFSVFWACQARRRP